MKVLQVTPAFYPAHLYGGPIQSIYHLCCHLGRVGCEVRILTTDANGLNAVLDVEKRQELEIEQNVRVRYCRRILRHAVSPLLVALLPKYVSWADIVHLRAVYSFPTIFTLLVCKVLRKPLVWTPHGAFQQWEGMKRKRAKALWEWICEIVTPRNMVIHTASEQEAQNAMDHFPNKDVIVIPHGIHVPPKLARRDHTEMLRLLYMGRLHPIKGLEQLLEACKLLNANFGKAWNLSIAGVGDPGYARLLEDRIASLGLRQQIKMVGEVTGTSKQELFSNIDIVVIPSFTESFSLVVAEALSHAVPVIASTGTPWKRIEDMKCGLWVRNDPESLGKAIQRMITLPLRQMGDNGREWMKKEFTWQRRTEEMLQCYERLLAKRSSFTGSLN